MNLYIRIRRVGAGVCQYEAATDRMLLLSRVCRTLQEKQETYARIDALIEEYKPFTKVFYGS